jgi:hypothetical protein
MASTLGSIHHPMFCICTWRNGALRRPSFVLGGGRTRLGEGPPYPVRFEVALFCVFSTSLPSYDLSLFHLSGRSKLKFSCNLKPGLYRVVSITKLSTILGHYGYFARPRFSGADMGIS